MGASTPNVPPSGLPASWPPDPEAGGFMSRETVTPLPTTVIPPSETAKPRASSASGSTPTFAPSGTTTFLSKIARWTTALRPMTACDKITE